MVSLHKMLLGEGFKVDQIVSKDESQDLTQNYLERMVGKEIQGYGSYPGNRVFDAKPVGFDSEEFSKSVVFYIREF